MFGAITAFCLVLYTTPYGIGVSPDSVVYIAAAKNFLKGNGFSSFDKLMVIYPPLYPFVLAVTDLIGRDMLQSARYLQALLFSLNTIIIGLIVRVLIKSNWAVLFSILLFISSSNVMDVHNMAWSEPLFIAIAISSYLALAAYISSQHLNLLIVSAALLGVALITRYAGIALLPPMVIVLFFIGSGIIWKRIRDCIILTAIGILPLSIWGIRNIILKKNVTGRTITFHPISLAHIRRLINTIYGFWLPIDMPFWLKAVLFSIILSLFCCGVFFLFKAYFRKAGFAVETSTNFQFLVTLFMFLYPIVVLVSLSFFDAYTVISYRIFLPWYVFSIFAFISVFWSIGREKKARYVLWIFAVFLSVSVLANTVNILSVVNKRQDNGRGFCSREWINSEIIEFTKSLPKGTVIYSNGADLIYFKTDKNARYLPVKKLSTSLQPNPAYDDEMSALCNEVARGDCLIVYFNKINRKHLPKKRELEDTYKIPVFCDLADGVIFGKAIPDWQK